MAVDYETSIKLPSGGFLEGSVAELQIRSMTVREEKIVFSRQLSVAAKFLQLLERCTDKDGVTIRQFPFNDVMYIFVKIRNLSVGDSKYTFKVPCLVCSSPIPIHIDVEFQPVTYLTEERAQEPYEVTLPLEEKTIALNHMRLHHQFEIDRIGKLRRARGQVMDDRMLPERLAILTRTIDGKEGSVPEKVQFFEGLRLQDLNYIDDVLQERDFGFDMRVIGTCPTCLSEDEYLMRLDPSFFRSPRRSSRLAGED